MTEMECYKSLDEIPIKNYDYFQKTGDLRYFLKDINFHKLPKITAKQAKDLSVNFNENIFVEFNKNQLDFELLNHYKKVVLANYEYVRQQNNIRLSKLNAEFAKYRVELDRRFYNFNFAGRIFKTAYDLIKYLKSLFDFETYMEIRLLIFDYKVISNVSEIKNKKKIDYRKVCMMLNHAGFQISYNISSFSDFIYAIEIANEINSKKK